MEELKITGSNGYLHIKFAEVFGFPHNTCYWGGYDVETSIEILSYGFSVKSILYLSTGNIFELYQGFKKCYETLEGQAYFESYESNLKFEMKFDKTGIVELTGKFTDNNFLQNELKFGFQSDQTYLLETHNHLSNIIKKYGNKNGNRNIS